MGDILMIFNWGDYTVKSAVCLSIVDDSKLLKFQSADFDNPGWQLATGIDGWWGASIWEKSLHITS